MKYNWRILIVSGLKCYDCNARDHGQECKRNPKQAKFEKECKPDSTNKMLFYLEDKKILKYVK